METEEISDRFVAPCFVNGLEAYDEEINLGKELIVALRGEIYFVKFIFNPEEDDVEPGVVFGRSFLCLTKAIFDFGTGTVTIYPELDLFLVSSEEEEKIDGENSRNKRRQLENYKLTYSDMGPLMSTRKPLTQEEAKREALAISIYERYSLVEEERPLIKTMAYSDKYKKILDRICLDKMKLDGIDKEEEEAIIKIKGEALIEKDDPGAFRGSTECKEGDHNVKSFEGRAYGAFKGCVVLESDSDDEEEYAIQRNKFGALIYGPKPARKIYVWKKVVSFLGSLLFALQHVDWKPDYTGSFNRKEDGDGQWHVEIRLTDPYGNVYDKGFVTKKTIKKLAKYHKLWEQMMMKSDHQDPNALDNMKPWRRYCSHKFILNYCNGKVTTKMQSQELFHEFYSTYEFDEVCDDDELKTKKIIKFIIGGRAHSLTLLEFTQRLGLYHSEELDKEGFDVNPVLMVLHKMITYGLCQRTTGYDKTQKNDLWLLSMFDARHQNGYANVAWLIVRYAYEGRLIPEDPQPGVSKVSIPRPPRSSMQELYDRMGRMEIRQEAIERMEYRQSYHWDSQLNTAYRSYDAAAAKMKVIKKEPEVLWMLEIEDDLFTCDTPLGMSFNEFNRLSGMNDDLYTYEVGIPKLSYPPHSEQQCDDLRNYEDLNVYEPRVCYDENKGIYDEVVIFVNKRLVRLMDVTIEQWLDLMYDDHRIVDKKIKEEVISKWLIRSYKKQFNEYIEIKKQWMTHGIDADMEYDPTDIRGDDDEVLTDKELFDLEETYAYEDDEIAEIFRIILDSKGAIPTMKAADAKTSNGLATIQAQLNNLGREIKKMNEKVYATKVGCESCGGRYRAAAPGFYQRDSGNPLYQEQRQIMEESLSKFMAESTKRHDENSNLIKEIRAVTNAAIRNQGVSIKTLEIQIGQMSKLTRPQYALSIPTDTPYEEIDVLDFATYLKKMLRERPKMGYQIKASTNENNLVVLEDPLPPKEKDPRSFTLPCYINNIYFEKALEYLVASISVMPLTTFTNLSLGELAPMELTVELADRTIKHAKGIENNILVGIGWNEERDIQDEREPMYDHDIGDLENDLVRDNAPYHANEEEDQYKEGRCKLLGDPNQEPPTCKIKRFEVIKYSFGPAEEFVAIKVCRYNDWKKTEEDVCRAYQDILAKMDKVGS
ncbi:hypothetical protein Tco_0612313 [Tanacetum coccineum]